MAFQTIFGFAFFYFLVASDAGRVGWSIGPWNHLLMNDITMTIKACELRLLDVQSMGYFDIPMNLFLLLLDVLMTVDAVLIDEIVFGQKLVGEDLTWFCMTVDTGNPGRMNRLGPHHDSGLIHMAMETDTWVGHENMTSRNDEGYPQNDDTWKDTEEKPFALNQVQDGILYEVSDFHSSDSSTMVLG